LAHYLVFHLHNGLDQDEFPEIDRTQSSYPKIYHRCTKLAQAEVDLFTKKACNNKAIHMAGIMLKVVKGKN
jgi:hypothetical protein